MTGPKGKKKRALFQRVIARDGFVCHWCKCPTRLAADTPGVPLPDDAATMDHVRRVADGGSNRLDNLVMCCLKCNQERGREQNPTQNARLIREWISDVNQEQVYESTSLAKAFEKASKSKQQ